MKSADDCIFVRIIDKLKNSVSQCEKSSYSEKDAKDTETNSMRFIKSVLLYECDKDR